MHAARLSLLGMLQVSAKNSSINTLCLCDHNQEPKLGHSYSSLYCYTKQANLLVTSYSCGISCKIGAYRTLSVGLYPYPQMLDYCESDWH
jgi:hypothetical protein